MREEDIKLPFAATTNQYTMLLRFRMDESQPTTKTFVSVLDCGYKGGESTKQGFYVRYYPESEQFGFLCNNGAKSINFDSPTNDTCRTLREMNTGRLSLCFLSQVNQIKAQLRR